MQVSSEEDIFTVELYALLVVNELLPYKIFQSYYIVSINIGEKVTYLDGKNKPHKRGTCKTLKIKIRTTGVCRLRQWNH